jgi:hypothetical protein
MVTLSSRQLGDCLAEYKTSAAGFTKVIAIMLASFAAAALFFAVAITGGPSDTGGRVVLFVLGALFSLPGLLCIYGLTRGRDNALRFFERGISIRKAGHEAEIAWDDVVSYRDGSFLIVETKNGDTFDFGLDGLRASDEILPRVREEVIVKRAVPRLLAAIRDGTPAEFEDATLDAHGITLLGTDRRIAWSDVIACTSTATVERKGKYLVSTTTVSIKTTSETFAFVNDDATDRETFISLCNEMRS